MKKIRKRSAAVKNSHRSVVRYIIIVILFTLSVLLYAGNLFGLQVANKYNYTVSSETTTKRYIKVKALRGKIYDRNGVLLVSNKVTYNIEIDKYKVKDADLPESFAELFMLLDENGIETSDRFAVTERAPFDFKDGYFDAYSTVFDKYAKENIKIKNYTADELMEYLIKKYKLENYDKYTARRIIGQLFEMYVTNYGYGAPYTVAKEIDSETINAIADKILIINGAGFSYSSEREILHGDFAAHIIGTVGRIFEEDYEEYSKLGYSMDAIVGRSGIEKAFEQYLRGYDGTLIQEVNEDGVIIKAYYASEPIAGKDVYLTIDYNLQVETQKALQRTIKRISLSSPGHHSGEDCNAGTIIVQAPDTAEILAMASYPTYDLSTYSTDYDKIASSPNSPLVNRALNGLYEPGSSFKVLTSIAALEECVITPDTAIYDSGIYKKYEPTYTPHCWYYDKHGKGHGALNVTGALQNSCNYFFFEVGDRLGIDKLNIYATAFGLGEKTGIEVAESTGILAGPSYRNSIQSTWYLGDTLQAAIGQSDNLFTPIQLSNYMSTFLNGGTRYQTHLLYCVKNFKDNSVYYQMPANILSHTDMSDSTYKTVKNAMRKVIEDGTAATTFNNFEIEVGGKTGSAQVSRGSANAIFIGFAPYEQPEIVVTVVLEHGSKGSNAAGAAKDVIAAYYGIDKDK